MGTELWSQDSFLDQLRAQADGAADLAVGRLHEDGGFDAVNRAFAMLTSDDQPLPPDSPQAFSDFMAATEKLPSGIDLERIQRGALAFERNAFPAALVLIASSLPSGYAAPCLSRILTVSDDLGNHPYRRLMGVLQLIVNVSRAGSYELAHLTARKLRLLHAGIRFIVPKFRPDYRERFGVPVNHEDMLATIMGFSLLVIDGLERLGAPFSPDEAEDFYYQWAAFALMMGIHPPDRAADGSMVPWNLADAQEFYDSYRRRNFASAGENPDGVRLSKINLQMMIDLIPRPLRILGFGRLPRIAMQDLLGSEGMTRVGIQPARGQAVERAFFHLLLKVVQALGSFAERGSEHLHWNLSLLVFQGMIDKGRGGEVRFIVPENVEEIRRDL